MTVRAVAFGCVRLHRVYKPGRVRSVLDALVRIPLGLDLSRWAQYAPVLAAMEDRETWTLVSDVYSVCATVAANAITLGEANAPSLITVRDHAIEALRPRI